MQPLPSGMVELCGTASPLVHQVCTHQMRWKSMALSGAVTWHQVAQQMHSHDSMHLTGVKMQSVGMCCNSTPTQPASLACCEPLSCPFFSWAVWFIICISSPFSCHSMPHSVVNCAITFPVKCLPQSFNEIVWREKRSSGVCELQDHKCLCPIDDDTTDSGCT